jgi:peptide/nickel transport system ATP-binding protein/oligopeptide transport system ATP-binding protein
MLFVRNLSKTYTSGLFTRSYTKAVDGVSFRVRRGEFFGIIGESGSGKTTVGKIITGLLDPSEGEVLISGRNIFSRRYNRTLKFKRRVQMIFQEPDGVMDPKWKIAKSMTEPYNLHFTMKRPEKLARVKHWISVMGLDPGHLGRYPNELSGGQLQRLAFARAMALEPDLIVADEPTSSLDVSVQAQMLGLMKDIQRQYQLTIVYITHDLYLARRICDSIAVMRDGRFLEIGPAEKIFSDPADEYTKELLRACLPPDMSARDAMDRKK